MAYDAAMSENTATKAVHSGSANNALPWVVFLGAFVLMALFSLRVAWSLPLFGDEAFYWLESRYLDWSYTDLPGWTAWQASLAENLGGHSYFGLRWLSWLAGLSVPWLGFWLAWQLHGLCCRESTEASPGQRRNTAALGALLVMAVPLLQVIGVLMLPDVWLLVFTLLLSNLLIQAIASDQARWWLAFALILALAVNTHVRLWIWLFFAVIALLLAWPQWALWKKLLTWAVPAAVIGLLPVLFFNAQHDWALFAFQFSRRHPWHFQPENAALIAAQVLLVSPLLIWLWGVGLMQTVAQTSKQSILSPACARPLRWIAWTALLHWLFYAITGLFADGERTTVHWLLASYLPVLAALPVWCCLRRQAPNKKTAAGGFCARPLLGWLASGSGLLLGAGVLLYLGSRPVADSPNTSRVLDNSSGWPEIARRVEATAAQQHLQNLVADYFMTAAEVGFELKRDDILVLPHPKNIKHGRQQQLQIMGLLLPAGSPPPQTALLVVEDSTLKLQEKGRYYLGLCANGGGLHWLETAVVAAGNKKFQLFRWQPQGTACHLPAFFYAEHRRDGNGLHISGWAVHHHQTNQPVRRQLWVHFLNPAGQWQVREIDTAALPNAGVARLFPGIHDPQLPNVGFAAELPANTHRYWLELREQLADGRWQSHPSRHFLVD